MVQPIPYILEFEFTYGAATRISPNVRRLVTNNPGPFTGWGTNVYLIGQDQLVIIDPGPNTDPHFDVLCEAIGPANLVGIFVTHHHKDHSPMARRLATQYRCKTYGFGPPECPQNPTDVALEAGEDMQFEPDIRLRDGEVFSKGNWQIECVHTPGHTSNHMCYRVLPDNGLVCGDHVLAWSTSVVIPPDGRMSDYLQSLQKVQSLQPAHLWPGHGPAIDDPKPFLSAYLAHRALRDTEILAQLQSGHKRIKQMVPEMYANIDSRLYPAASVSVFSHLIRLIEIGQVVCEAEPTIDALYRLA
ncbi:MAG: MBL fold metallo-hydrolase [Robiginitomaculum sp.]|nr:MAG: MBL fold metallo-hydrolase [Robiginitomaculum sp.]